MAITGTFLADFTAFEAAVKKAEVSLKGMETGAGKVESSLNKMVDSFSGRKIVQDATLITEAVERIGGASKLTEAEQAKVNRTVSEALEKYKALGQTAPAALVALEAATRKADDATKAHSQSWVTQIAQGQLLADVVHGVVSKLKDMVTALPELAMRGSVVADIEDSFEHLTAQSGLLAKSLVGTLRSATHGTVEDLDLMTRVNENLAAGVKLTEGQFGLLAKGAFALAQATGKDVKSSFDIMNDAMLTGRTRALAMLTGKIDLAHAEERYAHSLGTTTEHLSDEGKMEAARAAILESVAGAVERLGVQTDGLDEKVQQLQTTWGNFRDELGKSIATSPVIAAGFDSIRASLEEAFGGNQEEMIRKITEAVEAAAIVLVDFGLGGVAVAGVMVQAWGLIKTVVLGVESAIVGALAVVATAVEVAALASNLMPGAAAVTGDMAKKIADLARAARETANGLADETTAAWEMAKGNSEANKTLDKLGGALYVARDAMVAAQGATAAGTKGLKDHADAADHGAGAQHGLGLTIGQTAKEAAAAAKAMEAANDRLTASWKTIPEGQREHIALLLKEGQSVADIALKYHFTEGTIASYKREIERLAAVEKGLLGVHALTAEALGAIDFSVFHKAIGNPLAGVAALTQQELGAIDFAGFQGILSGLKGRVAPLTADELGIKNVKAFGEELERLRAKYQDVSVGSQEFNNSVEVGQMILGEVGGSYGQLGQQILGIVQSYKIAADASEESAARQAAAANMAMGVYGLIIAAMIRAARKSIEEFRELGDAIHDSQVTAFEAAVVSGEEYIDVFGRLITEEMVALKLQQQISEAVSGTGQAAADAQEEIQRLFDAFREGNRDTDLWTDQFGAFIAELERAGATVNGLTEALDTQQQRGASAIARSLEIMGGAYRKQSEDEAQILALRASHDKEYADLQRQLADATTDEQRERIRAQAMALQMAFDDKMRLLERDSAVQSGILSALNVDTEQEARALTGVILGDIAARMDAGESWLQSLRDQKDAVANLEAAMQAGGVGGTESFEQLRLMVGLATDEIAGPALEGLEGYITALTTLSNRNMYNADTFTALANQIGQTTSGLEALGYSHEQIMLAIQPDLQRVWELQAKYGFAVDESTQALINEAIANHQVGEEHKSTSEQMLDLMHQLADANDRIATGVERIAELFEDQFTVALRNMGKAAVEEFGRATGAAEEFHRTVGGIGSLGIGHEVFPQAAGGDYLVTRPTLFMAGEAGPERATFSPLVRGGFSGSSGSSGGARIAVSVDLRGAFLPDRQSISLLTRLIARELPNKLRDQGLGI